MFLAESLGSEGPTQLSSPNVDAVLLWTPHHLWRVSIWVDPEVDIQFQELSCTKLAYRTLATKAGKSLLATYRLLRYYIELAMNETWVPRLCIVIRQILEVNSLKINFHMWYKSHLMLGWISLCLVLAKWPPASSTPPKMYIRLEVQIAPWL